MIVCFPMSDQDVQEIAHPSTCVESIKIFARIRPSREKSSSKKRYAVEETSDGDAQKLPRLNFFIPRDEQQGSVNNSRENFNFNFNRVFDQKTTQDEVFDFVAKEVVERFDDGLEVPIVF